MSGTVTSYGEQADLYDGAGYPKLASERMRNFVTPQDITGNGFLMEFDQTPNTSHSNPSLYGLNQVTDSPHEHSKLTSTAWARTPGAVTASSCTSARPASRKI